VDRRAVEELMARRCLNFKELAVEMGISKSMMSYIVTRGGRKQVYALAKALKCKPGQLITVLGER
jgi:DNA-binding Xre family transcriptional regulator